MPCVPLARRRSGTPLCLVHPSSRARGAIATRHRTIRWTLPSGIRFTRPLGRRSARPARRREPAPARRGVFSNAATDERITRAVLRFLTGETDELSPCEDEPPDPSKTGPSRGASCRLDDSASRTIPPKTRTSTPSFSTLLLQRAISGRLLTTRAFLVTAPAHRMSEVDLEQTDTTPNATKHPIVRETKPSRIDLSCHSGQPADIHGRRHGARRGDPGELAWRQRRLRTELLVHHRSRRAAVLTQWRPLPARLPRTGELVRFTFVIRDGRGGTDWVERGLCVLPPPPE